MAQNRVWNFGALLTQGRFKLFGSALFTPGVYQGGAISIPTSTSIQFAPMVYMLPNGIVIEEDAAFTVTVPTPGTATDYTITADHDDVQAVGGSPALYTLRTGILGRSGDPNPNSLALLWIRHTGGAPLDLSMLSQPPLLQAGSLLSVVEDGFLPAPFPNACDVVAGANITATQQSHSSGPEHLGLQIVNSAATGVQNYQFRIPLPSFPVPRSIELYADIPALGSVRVGTAPYELYDAGGSVIGTTPSSVSGAVTAIDPAAAPAATFVLDNFSEAPSSLGVTVTVPAATAGVFLKGFNLVID